MRYTMLRSLAAASVFLFLGCAAGEERSAPPDLAAIREVMSAVEAYYVKPVADDVLLKGALKGMVGDLDPHSSYLDPKEYRDLRTETRGEFGGIGAELARDGGQVKIIAPIEDTPAARAGIKPGDIIRNVDGEPIEGLDLTQVVDKIRGPSGSRLRLTLTRGNEAPFDVELTRAVVRVDPVKARLERGRIGYARVTIFNEQAHAQLGRAIERLKREAGGRLSGFVLDLRNDPGGLLDEAVEVAGSFLNGGEIVSTRGRDGKLTRRFEAESNGDLLEGVPMVVLVNGASASASEIVAGALQDYRRATVMGTPSFGKGSVQTIVPLSRGGALRITTDLYYTPSGRSIQAQGVVPDITVEAPKEDLVAGARLTRESDLRDALKPPELGGGQVTRPVRPPPGSPPQPGEGVIDPLVIGTARDRQLTVAFDALRTGKIAAPAVRPSLPATAPSRGSVPPAARRS